MHDQMIEAKVTLYFLADGILEPMYIRYQQQHTSCGMMQSLPIIWHHLQTCLLNKPPTLLPGGRLSTTTGTP